MDMIMKKTLYLIDGTAYIHRAYHALTIRSKNMNTLERIVSDVKQLPPEFRVNLIQEIARTLIYQKPETSSKPLCYGKFKGEKQSVWEDFSLAEWRPSEKELKRCINIFSTPMR
jgi:hypothetical protein